jgi:hypothetical protein
MGDPASKRPRVEVVAARADYRLRGGCQLRDRQFDAPAIEPGIGCANISALYRTPR